MVYKFRCPRCRSLEVIKKGYIRGVQRYKCLKCGRTFYGTMENKASKLEKKQFKKKDKIRTRKDKSANNTYSDNLTKRLQILQNLTNQYEKP